MIGGILAACVLTLVLVVWAYRRYDTPKPVAPEPWMTMVFFRGFDETAEMCTYSHTDKKKHIFIHYTPSSVNELPGTVSGNVATVGGENYSQYHRTKELRTLVDQDGNKADLAVVPFTDVLDILIAPNALNGKVIGAPAPHTAYDQAMPVLPANEVIDGVFHITSNSSVDIKSTISATVPLYGMIPGGVPMYASGVIPIEARVFLLDDVYVFYNNATERTLYATAEQHTGTISNTTITPAAITGTLNGIESVFEFTNTAAKYSSPATHHDFIIVTGDGKVMAVAGDTITHSNGGLPAGYQYYRTE